MLPVHRLRFQHCLSVSLFCLLAACSTPPKQETVILPPAGKVFAQSSVRTDLLLNRLSFGANYSSYQQVLAVGPDRYLDQQLRARHSIVPGPIQAQIDSLTISKIPAEALVRQMEAQRVESERQKGTDDTLRKAYQQEMNRLAREAASRSLLRAVYSTNQLQEQMTWFWMNHFSIFSGKHNIRAMIGDFEESAIRPNALGNFRELLRATVYHPAMLRYLDNEYNAVNKINENYARELLELHTLGVNGGYTQKDVQELARVLTGVGVNMQAHPEVPKLRPEAAKLFVRKGLFEFHPQRHDFGDKLILGHTIRGRGLAETDEVIDMLSRHPATARFVSTKLAQFFVSAQPSDALISTMSSAFLRSDGDIPYTLRTMFDSEEFIRSLGKQFKDPLHYVVSSLRLTYDGSNIVNTAPALNWLNMLGQPYFGRQTPDGYSLAESAWSSAGQMSTRFDLARILANGNANLFRAEGQNSAEKFQAPTLSNASCIKNMLPYLSNETRQALAQAKNTTEWNLLFLASPEMMHR